MAGSATLVRGLGLIAATSIVISDVIGTGVFLKARVMTCNVGAPTLVVAVWVAGGLLSLAGALTYAELAAMMPRSGGEYVFLREAYGPACGFLYGWMRFFVGNGGALAALAAAFAIFLNVVSGGALGAQGIPALAIAAILLVTLVNCAAVSVGGHIATGLTTLKVALILGVGLGAFLLARGDWRISRSPAGAAPARASKPPLAAERPGSPPPCSARCGRTTAGTRSRTWRARSRIRSATCPWRSSAGSARWPRFTCS